MACRVAALVIIIAVISGTQGILVRGAHIRGSKHGVLVTDSLPLYGQNFLELNANSTEGLEAMVATTATASSSASTDEQSSSSDVLKSVATIVPEAAEAAGAINKIKEKAKDAGISTEDDGIPNTDQQNASFSQATRNETTEASPSPASDNLDADNIPSPNEFVKKAVEKSKQDEAIQELKDHDSEVKRAHEKVALRQSTTAQPSMGENLSGAKQIAHSPTLTTSTPLMITTSAPTTTSGPTLEKEAHDGHIVSIAGRYEKQFGESVCLKDQDTTMPKDDDKKKPDESKLNIAVLCCADNFSKDEVESHRKIDKKCHAGVSYNNAKNICEGKQWRLCTKLEVTTDEGGDSGCDQFDTLHVWTSDVCDPNAPLLKKEKKSSKALSLTTAAPGNYDPIPPAESRLFEGGIEPSDSEKANKEGIVILGKQSDTSIDLESDVPADANMNLFLQLSTLSTAALPREEVIPIGGLLPPINEGTTLKTGLQSNAEGVVLVDKVSPSQNQTKDEVSGHAEISIYQSQSWMGERNMKKNKGVLK